MDDKDIEYAVKNYQKKNKAGDYSYIEFLADIKEHIDRRPFPYNMYEPFILEKKISDLWRVLEMSMRDLVEYSKLDMAKFARRFCIPYRTLQAWCDGTNPCPVYIKMMIAEILKIYTRDVQDSKANYIIMQ